MRELILIVTDLFIAKGAAEPQSLPALPALSRLLAYARVDLTGDWRRWVMREFAAVDGGQAAVAAISHRAISVREPDPGSQRCWWLATPVHLEADLTCVRMGAQPLELSEDEWRTIRTEFNGLFGADGFQLDAANGTGAFLAASGPIDAVTTDPMRVLGQEIGAFLPSGAASSVLRRMMTGAQMWLYGHPLNEARAQRGVPTANALWIWGGGELPAASPVPAQLPRLFADEPFLQGLWRMLQGAVDAGPPSFARLMAASCSRALVALSGVSGTGSPAQLLDEMDRDWMAPVLRALRRGRIGCLALHLNDRLFRVTQLDTFRLWRRPRHWLEMAA